MSATETDRLLDAVLALDALARQRLLARIVGMVGGGGTVDADELRRQLVGLGTTETRQSAPSSQAGLASFVHLRSEPGATRTGS